MSMSENTILSLLKKAWNKFTVEYHCRIPKEILKEYIKKFIYEKNNIQKMVANILTLKKNRSIRSGFLIFRRWIEAHSFQISHF